MSKTETVVFSTVLIVYLALFAVTSSYPFFWDTIQLASKHATWFYQNGFKNLLLPAEIDSGHFPALGIYLAFAWKLFGRTLHVSHLIMLPFVLGIIWQSWLLIQKIFSGKSRSLAFVVLLSCPTLMAQCTLVSPDVILVFFFLMALNIGIFGKNKTWFMIALLGLSAVSLRGIICTSAIFMADLIIRLKLYYSRSQENLHRKIVKIFPEIIIPYIPAFIFVISFLIWHQAKTGWIGYNKDSPWYESFKPAGFTGLFRNIFIIGWRLADFGHIFVWISGIICLWHYLKHKSEIPETFKKLITIIVVVFIFLSFPMLIHKNLSGHRYLLPVYLLLSLNVCFYLFEIIGKVVIKNLLTFLMIAGLITGNLWVYPDRISQGWDASLAYLPYPVLRKKMMKDMDRMQVPVNETGSAFPNLALIDFVDLNGNMSSFAEKNFKTNEYIFWSNVFNDFSDDEIDRLKSEWIKIKDYECMNVKVILYKNPALSQNN